MTSVQSTYEAHAQDVIARLLDWQTFGKRVAIAVITETVGGGVRAPGSLMAITADGLSAGYLSGGCIDSDIVLQAQRSLEENSPVALHYGQGSRFIDLPLPCGGAIHVYIEPIDDSSKLHATLSTLQARSVGSLEFTVESETIKFDYKPKLRLRIAGRGADCLDLARLATASGLEVHLQLPDTNDCAVADQIGVSKLELLKTPETLPLVSDDPWTAFALMFHDRHWEAALLQQALEYPSFYIGAVGSPRTHAIRCQELSLSGVPQHEIARVHGPIGLVPSLRESSSIAVSTLAEVIAAFQTRTHNIYAESAVLLLAAGQSSRFENGDKLLADLRGQSVLATVASKAVEKRFRSRIAITAKKQSERQSTLKANHWSIVENPAPEQGLSSSLKLGIQVAQANSDIQSVLVLLADMPFVPDEHIEALYAALKPGVTAVMSEFEGKLTPPALFARASLSEILEAEGDQGARKIFKSLSNTATVPLRPEHAIDIDTVSDLISVKEVIHG
jgi:xanthine dehydrogenase accessory factor